MNGQENGLNPLAIRKSLLPYWIQNPQIFQEVWNYRGNKISSGAELEQRRIPTVTSREVKSGPVWRKNTPHDAPPTQKFCFDRFHHIFFSKKSLIFSQNCQKKKKKVFSRIKIFREYVAVGCGFRRFLNRKETNPGPFFFLSSYTHWHTFAWTSILKNSAEIIRLGEDTHWAPFLEISTSSWLILAKATLAHTKHRNVYPHRRESAKKRDKSKMRSHSTTSLFFFFLCKQIECKASTCAPTKKNWNR